MKWFVGYILGMVLTAAFIVGLSRYKEVPLNPDDMFELALAVVLWPVFWAIMIVG
jgi:hypothetical protein